MSEENEGAGFPAFFLNFGPTADQLEQMRMSAEDRRHKVRNFIETLDEEQIKTLIMIIETAIENDASGNFFIGMLIATLDQKFQACSGCGKNHDKMLAELSGQTEIPAVTSPEDKPSRDALMDEYGLEQVGDSILCKNCGIEYVSLEDRMLRPAGVTGCSTCLQKEKWG